jgi:hypothetical protein
MKQNENIELIKQAEQFRILKNFIKVEGVLMCDVERLVKAMDQEEEPTNE